MNKISNFWHSSAFLFILTFLSYTTGAFCIKTPDIEPLKQSGIAKQEEYVYYDSEGEEQEGETLIEIKGVGKILTYQDVYLASMIISFLSLMISEFIEDYIIDGKKFRNESLLYVIVANCVIGSLLIWLTSKVTIISTILFWLGIVPLVLVVKKKAKEE